MLYFAYGSNMNWEQMKQRCPSASFFGVAVLDDYKIAFTRRASKGHGVADIVSDSGGQVYGVVYRIDELDLGSLDKSEGYKPQRPMNQNAYRRFEVMVSLADEGKTPLTVMTYEVVNKEEKEILTSQDYKDLILTGANFWELPKDYVAKLEEIQTSGKKD